MQEIRTIVEAFHYKYDHLRPRGSRKDMAPIEFKEHRKSLTGRPPSKGFKAVTSKGENPKLGVITTGWEYKSSTAKHARFNSRYDKWGVFHWSCL